MVVSNFDAMIPYVFFLQFIKVKVGLEESCIAFLQVEEKKKHDATSFQLSNTRE